MSATSVPAVFLGRDGVLVEDRGYPRDDAHLTLARGAESAVARLNRAGYLVVMLPDPPGAARGLPSPELDRAFNDLVVRRLAARGARIGAVHDGSSLGHAVDAHHVDTARSFLIAERSEDIAAARALGVSVFRFDGGDLDAFVRELLGG